MGHLTDDEIVEFCKSWCEAEDSLKHVESQLVQLPQQPVNELRYATRHFSRAVNAITRGDCEQEYKAALRHCTCAAYDTSEAVLLFRCLRFKKFQEDFSDFPIETPVLDYRAAQLAYQDAQDSISRDPTNRHERREHIRKACEALSDFDRILDVARNELNKKRQRAPQTESGAARRFRVQVGTMILVALISAGCTFLAKTMLDEGARPAKKLQPAK